MTLLENHLDSSAYNVCDSILALLLSKGVGIVNLTAQTSDKLIQYGIINELYLILNSLSQKTGMKVWKVCVKPIQHYREIK